MTRNLRRRSFLQLGLGAGLAGLLPRVARAAGQRRRLLVYFNDGGWDTTQVFDPHFESDAVDRDPDAVPDAVGDLAFAHAPSRPSVQAFFQHHGDRTVVVNGIGVGSISHAQCARIMLAGSPVELAPDVATVIASTVGADLPLPHVVLSGPRFPGTIGRYQVPLNHLLVGTARGELPEGRFDPSREALLRRYLQDVGDLRLAGTGDPRHAEFLHAVQTLPQLEAGLDGLAVSQTSSAAEHLDVAVQALARGLSSCAIVQGEVPTMNGWDSHSDNDQLQDLCYEATFDVLDRLVDQLITTTGPDGQPLIASTTLLVVSEMGRLPRTNAQLGKDHWPFTSAMVIGAGVAGGRVVGATDGGLNGLPVDADSGQAASAGIALTSAAFIAGLLEQFDVDPGEFLPGVPAFRAPFA